MWRATFLQRNWDRTQTLTAWTEAKIPPTPVGMDGAGHEKTPGGYRQPAPKKLLRGGRLVGGLPTQG